jgi:Zn-dependent protease with chaperone function
MMQTEGRPDEPIPPPELAIEEYALPEDRRALARLRTLRPLVAATRWYIRYLGEPMTRSRMLGGAVRVGERQFPALHAIAGQCARVLHMEAPELFVVQEPRLNAYTYGHERPLVILTSGLVDAMNEWELAFVLGHEMGHIKSEHVLFVNLAEFLRTGASVAVQWAAAPALLALFAWQRTAERTADRAGVIACQNVSAAEAALIKLALGSAPLFAEIDREEYLRQTETLRAGQARLALALQNHPYTAERVAALRAWAASDAYRALWEPRPSVAAGTEESASPLVTAAGRAGARAAEAVYGVTAAARRARAGLDEITGALRSSPPRTAPGATASPDEEPV